jgi:hypothetical protein
MKKWVILLFMVPLLGLGQSKTGIGTKEKGISIPNTKQEIAKTLAPEWDNYVRACFNDSSLQVVWIYTGKEKPEIKMDSTIIKGRKTRVITIIPTQQMQWIRPNPTWKGFEEYLLLK